MTLFRLQRSCPRASLSWAGVAVCLFIAGCGKSADAPTQVAARVNKDEISVHQINQVLQRQQGIKPEQAEAASRQILERLIDQEVAVQKAEELKLDREPRVMQAIQASRNEIVARAYAERMAESTAKPTADEVQAYYDSKPALFSQRRMYQLQEVQVQGPPEQMAALRTKVQAATSIKEVTDFINSAGLPARASQSTAAAESLPLPLVDQFARMKPGQALFLPAQGGARIVVVASVQPAPMSLEQARPVVEQALSNERRREAVEADLKALRKASKVEYLGRFAAQAASAAPERPVAEARPASSASLTAGAEALDAGTVNKGLAGLK